MRQNREICEERVFTAQGVRNLGVQHAQLLRGGGRSEAAVSCMGAVLTVFISKQASTPLLGRLASRPDGLERRGLESAGTAGGGGSAGGTGGTGGGRRWCGPARRVATRLATTSARPRRVDTGGAIELRTNRDAFEAGTLGTHHRQVRLVSRVLDRLRDQYEASFEAFVPAPSGGVIPAAAWRVQPWRCLSAAVSLELASCGNSPAPFSW
jgi:hypothetical protein